jgi:hypothetical protein
VTEEQFQDTVVAMCKLLGIAWYHPFFSRKSAAGWPDLALCGSRGFLLRELKTERGKLTADQERWGSILRTAGVSWDVWRPDDLRSGRIQRELLDIR